MGTGNGTSPLPIFLAYFNGINRERLGDASRIRRRISAAARSDSAGAVQPEPMPAVDALDAAEARTHALNAGLPANFIVANPDLPRRRQPGRERLGDGITRWLSSSAAARRQPAIPDQLRARQGDDSLASCRCAATVRWFATAMKVM